MPRQLIVGILSDASKFKRGLDQATHQANGFAKKMHGVGMLAGAALASGLLAFGTKGIKSLERIEKIGAQTDAVLRSTGSVAGLTRGHIDDLAGQLEKLTSVEAETITMGQNMLLTFTGIRNAAGAGNDIFDQATKTIVDMSVAMGTDTVTQAVRLGKALQDPVKGVSALSRVGVAFSAKQKDMIKTMVESGDVMGAQKIILGELQTEFGGAGEALGGTLAGKLKLVGHSFGTVQEAIMTGMLPALTQLASVALKTTEWMEAHPKAAKALALGIGGLAAAFFIAAGAAIAFNIAASPVTLPVLAVVGALALLGTAFGLAWKNSETFRDVVVGGFNMIKNVVATALQWMVKLWVLYNVAVLTGIQKMLQAAGKLPKWLGGGAFDAAADFVGKMIDGIQAIGSAVDTLAEKARGANWELSHMDDMGAAASAAALGDAGFNKQLADDLAGRSRDSVVIGGGVADPYKIPKTADKAEKAAKVKQAAIKVGQAWVDGIRVGIDHKATEVKDAISRVIDAAKARLAKARDLAKSIKDTFAYTLNAMSFDQDGGHSASLLFDLDQQVANMKRFIKVIGQLRKAGLRGSAITKLVDAGPDALGAAEEILNSGQIKDINNDIDLLKSMGTTLSNSEVLRRTGTDLSKAQPVRVVFDVTGADKEMKALIKKIVRTDAGGDVQVAFGKA